jgi:hypothetical protein
MGVDFINGKAKGFRKGWDREALSLASPDLFREQPTSEARQIQGALRPCETATIGETLTVRLTETGIVAFRMNTIIADFGSLPDVVLEALRKGCGVATARVEYVGTIGSTLRVSLK